jgi:hypothetical protein
MIFYTHDELQTLVSSLYTTTIMGSYIPIVVIMVERYNKSIELPSFIEVLKCPNKSRLNRINLGNLRYISSKTWLTMPDISELYDVIFKLEFDRVPLILDSFPEVAKWRLRVGK